MRQGYVVGSIFVAVAFVEAKINELFTDAGEPCGGYLKSLDPEIRGLMAESWASGVPRGARHPVVKKYDEALSLARKPAFDTGARP